MSAKVILLAIVIFVAIFIAAGGCVMFFTDLFGWKGWPINGNVDPMNTTESSLLPDYDDEGSSMSSESVTLTPDVNGMIDGMFPDHITDDLKLILILKALAILKTLDGENPEYVKTLLPSNDEMTDELKVRLILKAILLLSDKPFTSMFGGHVVAELKLTLLLKAIFILKEVREDVGSTDNLDELKLSLVRKALYILKIYRGEFEDTVFKTKNRLHLKLKLTLLYLSLSKSVSRHARDVYNFWPIKGGEVDGDGQSKPTVRVRIDNGGLVPEVTTPKQTTPEEREIPGSKKRVLKVFKWLKWLPNVLHKKEHNIKY